MGLLIISLFVLFGFSWIATWCAKTYAVRHSLYDIPNNRSSHEVPTPRGGGVGFVATFGCFLISSRIFYPLVDIGLMYAFGGAFVVAAIGFWDDHQHVAISIRLFFHFAAACFACNQLVFIAMKGPDGTVYDNVLFLALLVVVIIWCVNLYNFMDGIDGLAVCEAITISCSAAVLLLLNGEVNFFIVVTALAAVLGGFLIWNFPRAHIFMGDVGSGFLGYIFAVFGVYSISDQTALTPWTWLILSTVFLIDSTVTLIRRFIRRESWYKAHRNHAYQKAARKYGRHLPVTIAVCVINLFWLFPLAWLSVQYPQKGAFLFIAASTPLVILAFNLGAGISD